MDERLASCIAIPTADIAASLALAAFFPRSPILANYESLLGYSIDRIGIVVFLWLVIAIVLWLFRPAFLRRRHNVGTRISFLVYTCTTGVILDNLATINQVGFNYASIATSPVFLSMAIRSITFIFCFATITVAAYLIEARRLPAFIRPEKFGRH